MKANVLIPLIASAAICGGILIAQAMRNRALDARVTGLRAAATPSATALATEDVPSQPRPASVPPRTVLGNEPARPGSPEFDRRVERSVKNLSLKLSGMSDIQSSPAAFFGVLPTVLQSVSHLSVAELIAVADGMGSGGVLFPPTDAAAAARMMLYLLAAEHEPLVILDRQDLELGAAEGGLQASVFGILARKDPDAALRWLEGQDLAGHRKSAYQTQAALGLLAHDPRRGLDYVLANPGVLPSGGMGQMIAGIEMTDSARAELLGALPDPRYADIRPHLAPVLLGSSATTAGIDELRAQTRSLQLADKDVATFLRNHASTLIQGDPANAAAWMRETMTADQYSQAMATAIREWTQRDFNAAAAFVSEMDRGPARDSSIQAFAATVVWMEPESAAAWASEIDDAAIRQAACQEVGRVWAHKDRDAASQWMERQGIEAPAAEAPHAESPEH